MRRTLRDGGSPAAVGAVATLAALIVLLGVQGIAPLTPGVRDEFGLSSGAIASFTLVYVAGAAIFGFPATALADRIGIRKVLVGALLVFGILGISGSVTHDYLLLLAMRLVQGAAFGTVMALTIVLIVVDGSPAMTTRRLRNRTIVTTLGEAVLPVLVGIVATSMGWRVGFALQGVSVLVAILCIVFIPADVRRPSGQRGGSMRLALRALRTPFGATAQLPAVVRFLVKFSLLTYVPIVAADALGLDAAATGVIIGIGAVAAVATAALAPLVLKKAGTALAIALSMGLTAAPLLFFPLVSTPAHIVILVVVSGLGDGLLAVFLNMIASVAAPRDARAAYLGLSGSVRNGSKVAAPAILGLLLLVVPLPVAFAVVGVFGLLPLAAVPTLVRGIETSRHGVSGE